MIDDAYLLPGIDTPATRDPLSPEERWLRNFRWSGLDPAFGQQILVQDSVSGGLFLIPRILFDSPRKAILQWGIATRRLTLV